MPEKPEDIEAGTYRSRSDAYISILREYYRRRSEDNVLQRISDLEKRMDDVEAEQKKNV